MSLQGTVLYEFEVTTVKTVLVEVTSDEEGIEMAMVQGDGCPIHGYGAWLLKVAGQLANNESCDDPDGVITWGSIDSEDVHVRVVNSEILDNE